MTRPKKKLDWERVDELLEMGCLGTEIASHLNIHPNTFYEKVQEEQRVGFTEYSQQKKAKGNALLREAQFNLAVKDKDRAMLIWLGKQRLGQREPEPPEDKEIAKGAFNLWWEEINTLKKEVE